MTPQWQHTAHAQRIRFGAGCLGELPDLVKQLGVRRVMLVASERRAGGDDGQRLCRLLGRTLASTFAGVLPHVPAAAVQAAFAQARRDNVDAVVSLGGGAAIDTAKAVCYFTEQQAGTPAVSFHDRPAIAHVAVPTAYSGAESTGTFAMTDDRSRTTGEAGSATLVPVAVFYDPLATLDLSGRTSAATAITALAHCVEAAWSPRRSPEAEALALAGATRIVGAVTRVDDDPADVDARATLLEGAALASRAMANAAMGAHHGLAQLLGGRTAIPHGVAHAALLAHTMRFNADVVPDAMARLATAIGAEGDPADAVAGLVARLRLPASLSGLRVVAEDLEAVARLSQSHPAVQRNVRPVGEADALAILRDAW